jgi:heme-degrading monooxygenase HmoA
VIARIWTARTTRAQAAAYAEYLQTHVFVSLRGIDGYEYALLLQRPSTPLRAGDSNEEVELQVITFWQSLDAIRAFAGTDVEAAVVTPDAAALLTGYDRRARHFAVVLRDGPQ